MIPSLLSCLDTGKKSTPMSAGIPVLGGFGICSATKKKQHIQYHSNSITNIQNIYGGQNTLASLNKT